MLNKQGYALLPKDSLGDVPKRAPNEESAKGTTSKDDAGNLTTSDSNVDCASPSEKVRPNNVLYIFYFLEIIVGARTAPLCGEMCDFR